MRTCCKLLFLLLPCSIGCAAFPAQSVGLMPHPAEFDSTFAIARAYEKQGNVNHALEIYSRLLAQNAEHGELHHRLGVIAVRQSRPDEAMVHFEKALKTMPNDPDLLADIGYTLYLQGNFKDAEQKLQRVVSDNPGNERAANNLGLVLAKQGQTSEAFRVFRKSGSEAEAHANLAYVYASSGQIDLAERHYSRALDYDENLTQASEALLQLDGIRHDFKAGSDTPEDRSVAEAAMRRPIEDPESPEFASRWRTQDQALAGRTPEAFQFDDRVYEQPRSEVVTADHRTSTMQNQVRQTSAKLSADSN